jgi:hypothetical protein
MNTIDLSYFEEKHFSVRWTVLAHLIKIGRPPTSPLAKFHESRHRVLACNASSEEKYYMYTLAALACCRTWPSRCDYQVLHFFILSFCIQPYYEKSHFHSSSMYYSETWVYRIRWDQEWKSIKGEFVKLRVLGSIPNSRAISFLGVHPASASSIAAIFVSKL